MRQAVALYTAAAIMVGMMTSDIARLACKPLVPAQIMLAAAAWPLMMGLVSYMKMVGMEAFPSACNVKVPTP